eukprot:1226531-Rhodomonas_salina.1
MYEKATTIVRITIWWIMVASGRVVTCTQQQMGNVFLNGPENDAGCEIKTNTNSWIYVCTVMLLMSFDCALLRGFKGLMPRAVRAALVVCIVFGASLEGSLAFSTIFASKFASPFLRGGGSLQPAKLLSLSSQPSKFFQAAPFRDVRRSLSENTLVQLSMNKALARPSSAKGGGGGDGKRVAIIGGGIAGLVCANRLQQLGFEPFVYDTGKKAVGGRVSSRVLSVPTVGSGDESTKENTKGTGNTKGKKTSMTQYKVDHSSQFFTADDIRYCLLSIVLAFHSKYVTNPNTLQIPESRGGSPGPGPGPGVDGTGRRDNGKDVRAPSLQSRGSRTAEAVCGSGRDGHGQQRSGEAAQVRDRLLGCQGASARERAVEALQVSPFLATLKPRPWTLPVYPQSLTLDPGPWTLE